MSRLREASDRLDRAIARLGTALDNRDDPSLQDRIDALEASLATVERERNTLRTDLDNLKSDQTRLNTALKDAQENYAAMQVVNEAVAGRLDGAIGTLRALMER